MRLRVFDEPPLQFSAGRHVDIRAGLWKYGALSRTFGTVPNPIGVGLIGTGSTVDDLEEWFTQCSRGIPSSEKKLIELRPAFPGMTEAIYGTKLRVVATRTVTKNELFDALEQKDRVNAIVDRFLKDAEDLADKPNIHVLMIAPPSEVFDLPAPTNSAEQADETPANFHDVFKARALSLRVPCQVIRPETYGGETRYGEGKRTSLQEPATRAWNLHTALYYKAGGVPWRLVDASELDTCYVGASFYQSHDKDALLTSVAQVFNEHGEGLILKGANARVDEEDRTPHLRESDAHELLWSGLERYRREHKHMPSRVVMHKTSYFDDEELDGFRSAAKKQKVNLLELVWVRPSRVRLFRAADHPVRRGTVMQIDNATGIVYLKGLVPYFRMYPGPYVPRPLEFVREDGETSIYELGREMLELSKLNFNNTQFDSGDPITIRAARRVGDILKHVRKGETVERQFRYFT